MFHFFYDHYSSVRTQLPYDYYSLNFCKPKEGVKPYGENLGEFLRGDRIENSAYEVRILLWYFYFYSYIKQSFFIKFHLYSSRFQC